MSVADPREGVSPLRGLTPLWVGVGIYALFLLAGNRSLIDPDTMWQVTVGQWILDHRAVPQTDVHSFTMRGQPWISTQWLAQVLYAKTFAVAGWRGPLVLASTAIAATFALLTKSLTRRLRDSTALIFVAAALALTVPHLLARPLDHMDGWQKVYSDDIATIHVRRPDAVHTAEPVIDPKTK